MTLALPPTATDATTDAVPPRRPLARHWLKRRLLLLAAVIALFDVLFLVPLFMSRFSDERDVGGLAFALFFAALAIVAWACNPHRANRRQCFVAAALVVAGLAADLADGGILAFCLSLTATGAAALLVATPALPWEKLPLRLLLLPIVGWGRLLVDTLRAAQVVRRYGRRGGGSGWLGWMVPLVLSLVFIAIFAAGNPIVANWLAMLDPSRLKLSDDLIVRPFLYLILAATIWPFFHLGRSARAAKLKPLAAPTTVRDAGLFGEAALVRSLVAFNAIFVVQTATDINAALTGAGLPADMSLAEYAHRGAYPLMLAAVVAAGFILIALRGGEDNRHRLLRPLLITFAAEGLLLVASSLLRLDIYVDTSGLTLWRAAACVWMGLVAFGFATILVRILSRRSNAWLKNVNAAAALLTLWGCCFVDEADLVTRYNLAQCAATTGPCDRLDIDYLTSFRSRAIPAFDAYREALANHRFPTLYSRDQTGTSPMEALTRWRNGIVASHKDHPLPWRAWTLAGWRLDRYISSAADWPAPTVATDTPR